MIRRSSAFRNLAGAARVPGRTSLLVKCSPDSGPAAPAATAQAAPPRRARTAPRPRLGFPACKEGRPIGMRENALRRAWRRRRPVNGWLSIRARCAGSCPPAWDSSRSNAARRDRLQAMIGAPGDLDPQRCCPWRGSRLEPGIVMKDAAGAYGVICPMNQQRRGGRPLRLCCRYAHLGQPQLGPIRARLRRAATTAARERRGLPSP